MTKGPTLVVSASDDSTAKLWDVRLKRAVKTLPDPFQLTAACFSADNSHVITGGLDGDIKVSEQFRHVVRISQLTRLSPCY